MTMEAWSPEDEPPTREEALAYERFLRVLLKEKDGKVPEALARKYLNTLLDPEFARRQPRTHARMLENYHRMVQKDRHMAIAQGLLIDESKATPKTWHIHIHSEDQEPERTSCSCGDPNCKTGQVPAAGDG